MLLSALICVSVGVFGTHGIGQEIKGRSACEPITVSMCSNMGYTTARFPNSLGHTTYMDAAYEATKYHIFVNFNCSKSFKEFICLLLFPPCDPNDGGQEIKLPSREVCEDSRTGCEPLLNHFSMNWKFSCEAFPSTDPATTNKDPGPSSCEPIKTSMCNDIGYLMASFPNRLGQSSSADAALEASRHYPLVKIKCSPFIKKFLCHLYFPPCNLQNVSALILPTQYLCEQSQKTCEPLMNKFGMEWEFDCGMFSG